MFGVFALYVIWFSEARTRFEAAAAEAPPPEASDADIDEAWSEGESPYAYARRMADAGLRVGRLRARLEEGGLAPDEVETLLGAVGLGTERGPP